MVYSCLVSTDKPTRTQSSAAGLNLYGENGNVTQSLIYYKLSTSLLIPDSHSRFLTCDSKKCWSCSCWVMLQSQWTQGHTLTFKKMSRLPLLIVQDRFCTIPLQPELKMWTILNVWGCVAVLGGYEKLCENHEPPSWSSKHSKLSLSFSKEQW